MKYWLVIFCFCFSYKLSAQNYSAIEEHIVNSADAMFTAFKTKDWKSYAQFIHPGLIASVGGEQAFIQLTEEQMKNIPDSAFKKVSLGKLVQVIQVENGYQCVIEQLMEMQVQNVLLQASIYLIGESDATGKVWKFFDNADQDLDAAKAIMPSIHTSLSIPKRKQQVKRID